MILPVIVTVYHTHVFLYLLGSCIDDTAREKICSLEFSDYNIICSIKFCRTSVNRENQHIYVCVWSIVSCRRGKCTCCNVEGRTSIVLGVKFAII